MQLNFIMPTFVLEDMEAVKGKQSFKKLSIDGCCLFDDFELNLEGSLKSELGAIYAYMNEVANLKSLPNNKFHFYNDQKGGYREFEFKSKHLRVYGITIKNGKLIILGGTKAKQKKDESVFRSIKKQFIESLK